MAFGYDSKPHNWNTNEKLRWSTNDDVFHAFRVKRLKGVRSKNVAYFANDRSVYSYGLKIGTWDGNTAIILEEGCSSVTTNSHILDLHRKMAGIPHIFVPLHNIGAWGRFPSKDYWYSVLSPNCVVDTFSALMDYAKRMQSSNYKFTGNEIRLNKVVKYVATGIFDEKMQEYEMAVNGYCYNNKFIISKINKKYEMVLFSKSYYFKRVKDFRIFCELFDYVFDNTINSLRSYLYTNHEHVHYDCVVEFINGFKEYLENQ